jgi:predicted AAA+ superfamily ATPase
MEETVREKIFAISEDRMEEVPLAFKRRLYGEIGWDERLVCLKGPRGAGKTTILLQRMKEALGPEKALYVSLDNVWVEPREVYGLAEYHLGRGGTHLFLDEVHKLEDWQNLVKSLNDDLKRLSVVYSGSSLLKLEKKGGDLSRRQATYHLPGLSFRESLAFEGLADLPPVPLARLLRDHARIARSIRDRLPVLKHFEEYRLRGYYPFYREAPRQYGPRIVQIANQVLEVDYPEIEAVETATVRKARRMLNILASSAPQTPNMEKLWRELGTDRKQGLKMLYALERAGLLALLSSARRETLKHLATPDKIYCDNPNLMAALVARPDTGTMRETFLLNQLRAAGHAVAYPPRGDFLVDGRILLEVGGPGKTFRQIADAPDSYLALDDTETGHGNRIPLWMFGLLY